MDFSGRIRAVLERYGFEERRAEVLGPILVAARSCGGDEPGDLLGRCWSRMLSEGVADGEVEELWRRAFAGQGAEGYLHKLNAETSLEVFVYEELRAIHAAYQVARRGGRPEMMERVRRAVRWHVTNTQPDHGTSEPWGLAAFAELDETGTFAEAQLHAAENMLAWRGKEKEAVTLALLADALGTIEAGLNDE